jgi:hypothetical protein
VGQPRKVERTDERWKVERTDERLLLRDTSRNLVWPDLVELRLLHFPWDTLG